MIEIFDLANEDETKELGALLARRIASPSLIFLRGDLGFGKTTLARGFISQFVNARFIQSPTFAYVQTYPGNIALYHFDFYRLENVEVVYELGLDALLDDEDAMRLVEWPERISLFNRKPDIDIELSMRSSGRRATVNFLSARALKQNIKR